MDIVINKLLNESQSIIKDQYEKALSDLRFVIERYTMNRFNKKEENDYLKLFYNHDLIHYRIDIQDFDLVKKILIYILFNFPDRAVLTAKCIKALFDHSISEAICNGIETYLKKDDLATCELIYAITNSYEDQSYLQDDRILKLFQEISMQGGTYSRAIIEDELNSMRK
jgi:hypothetical protein